jgi:hypothetical protein
MCLWFVGAIYEKFFKLFVLNAESPGFWPGLLTVMIVKLNQPHQT